MRAPLANCASYLKSFHGADITIEEILATVDKALRLNPRLAEAHAARGIAYAVDDRREETVSAFGKALELDPANWGALFAALRHHPRYEELLAKVKSTDKPS
jgi:adenylate cyclase